jgi:hypothetical protein
MVFTGNMYCKKYKSIAARSQRRKRSRRTLHSCKEDAHGKRTGHPATERYLPSAAGAKEDTQNRNPTPAEEEIGKGEYLDGSKNAVFPFGDAGSFL